MDKDQLEQLKRLVGLFEDRDRLYQKSTEKILEAVGPTTLEALFALFDVPYEKVTWLEVQLIDKVLLIVASIAYEDNQKVPEVIQALSPVPADGRASVRLFRVGVPLEVIFKPKEEIVAYLSQTAGVAAKRLQQRQQEIAPVDDDSVSVTTPTPSPDFDTSELTRDQVLQLLLHGSTTRGTKH